MNADFSSDPARGEPSWIAGMVRHSIEIGLEKNRNVDFELSAEMFMVTEMTLWLASDSPLLDERNVSRDMLINQSVVLLPEFVEFLILRRTSKPFPYRERGGRKKIITEEFVKLNYRYFMANKCACWPQ